MQGIFSLLYLFLFLGFVIASFFILFHLSRYALNRRVASLAALIFMVVAGILLFTNAILFFQIPFESLLPTSTGYSPFR